MLRWGYQWRKKYFTIFTKVTHFKVNFNPWRKNCSGYVFISRKKAFFFLSFQNITTSMIFVFCFFVFVFFFFLFLFSFRRKLQLIFFKNQNLKWSKLGSSWAIHGFMKLFITKERNRAKIKVKIKSLIKNINAGTIHRMYHRQIHKYGHVRNGHIMFITIEHIKNIGISKFENM